MTKKDKRQPPEMVGVSFKLPVKTKETLEDIKRRLRRVGAGRVAFEKYVVAYLIDTADADAVARAMTRKAPPKK